MILFTTKQNYINIIDNDYQYHNKMRMSCEMSRNQVQEEEYKTDEKPCRIKFFLRFFVVF